MKKLIFTCIFCSVAFITCQSETENTSPKEAATSMLTDDSQSKGKVLFQTNCAACHNPVKDMTGPALKGVLARVPSKEWLYRYIYNSKEVIDSGDEYATTLYEKWNKTAMTPFTQLSHDQIDAILAYCDSQ